MNDKPFNQEAWELANKIANGEVTLQEAMLQTMERVAVLENSQPGRDKESQVAAMCRRDLMMTVTDLMRKTEWNAAAVTVALASVTATLCATSTDPDAVAKAIHDTVMEKINTPKRKRLTQTMLMLLAAIGQKVAVGKTG